MERAGAPQAAKTREWAAALAAALPEMKVVGVSFICWTPTMRFERAAAEDPARRGFGCRTGRTARMTRASPPNVASPEPPALIAAEPS